MSRPVAVFFDQDDLYPPSTVAGGQGSLHGFEDDGLTRLDEAYLRSVPGYDRFNQSRDSAVAAPETGASVDGGLQYYGHFDDSWYVLQPYSMYQTLTRQPFRRVTDQLDRPPSPATPSLVSAGASTSGSSEQSHSIPVTPSPSPELGLLAVSAFGDYPGTDSVMDCEEEEDDVLPPVAGPSTTRTGHSSELEQPADLDELDELDDSDDSDDEGTASNPLLKALSSAKYQCPFKRNGRRCEKMLVHNEKRIKRHMKKHRNAGELPKKVKPCLLCDLFPEHAKAPGRRKQTKDRKSKKDSSLQSIVRHIFNIHFGGGPVVCHHCGKTFSRKDAVDRHLKKVRKGSDSSSKDS